MDNTELPLLNLTGLTSDGVDEVARAEGTGEDGADTA